MLYKTFSLFCATQLSFNTKNKFQVSISSLVRGYFAHLKQSWLAISSSVWLYLKERRVRHTFVNTVEAIKTTRVIGNDETFPSISRMCTNFPRKSHTGWLLYWRHLTLIFKKLERMTPVTVVI